MATILDGVSAETLTDSEALALGMSSIVHGGQLDPDNQMVNAMLAGAGLPQTDKDGRPIISFKQFEEISKSGARIDPYALRVMRPGNRGTWVIQASKYQKWFGLGYEAVGTPPERTHLGVEIRREVEGELADSVDTENLNEGAAVKAIEKFINKNAAAVAAEIHRRLGVLSAPSRHPVRTAVPVEAEEDAVTIYYCRDKYPECSRFFDNEKGLKFHWRRDHEGALKGRKADE